MKTKSGKFRTIKAALLFLIMVTLTIGSGYGQLVGFNGKLPKKNFVKTKYKCKHVGVQKVKHVKLKTSPKQEVNTFVLNKTSEHVTASLVTSTPTVFAEPVLVVKSEPVVELKEEPTLRLVPQPVYFRYDSYRLDIIDLTQVALAVEYVNEGKAITLIGHADNWGSEQYNDFLSLKRATIIKDMMVKLGCNPELITVKGEGERYPAASNDHEVGRQNNRRVEFLLSDKAK
jgi:outer membrane protein OmpA-like peptidoglycan-associated protein